MKLLKILFLFLFLINSSFADINDDIKNIAKISANSLYNLDNDQLELSITPYLKGHPNFKAVKIIDATDDSIFVQAYNQNSIIIFDKIPKEKESFIQYTENITFNDEIIGKIIVYYKDSATVDLTLDEQKYIETHIVKIGVEQWSPVVFSNNGKDIDGISGDFTKKIIEVTGLKVKIVNDNWNKLLLDFEDKKLDILPATYYTDKRAKFGLYSDGYFKMKDAIYVKSTTKDINSLQNLEGKTLAIPKGYGTIDKLKEKFPNIKLVFTKNLDDSINRVLNGRVVAFYEGQIAANAKISDELIQDLKAISVKSFKAPDLHYLSKIDEPLLQSIIQKGLNSISYQDRVKIISKWVGQSSTIELSEDEQKWLDKNKAIKFSFDPEWRPLEWADNMKEHTGIVSDLLKLINQKSGVKFNPIHSNSWNEAIEKVKTKKSDAFSAGETLTRKEYVNFTKKSILKTPYVFVSRNGEDYLEGFTDAKNKKIALLNNSTIHHLMVENLPTQKLTILNSDVDMFEKLENKEVDIIILNAITAKYYINTLGYENLKIAYKTKFNLDMKFALRKDFDQTALKIIDKTLESISQKEIDDIVDKWTRVTTKTKTNWLLIAQIGGVVLLLILFILWNNYKLKSKVEEKTKNIEKQKDELEYLSKNLEKKVAEQTKDIKKQLRIVKMSERKQTELMDVLSVAKKEVEAIHKHTRESIEYASLIQGAVVSQAYEIQPYFKDSFVYWMPKDTVGGDIWLFNELRHEDECLLFFIDCTGHGVPGAFVTMIVKAVEREITAKINDDINMVISPAWVMAYFNSTMKVLLKQEDKTSISNAGWDGGVIYYNRRDQILKFAGAETPLFYMTKDDEFKTIKGNRYSVGYKKCAMDYEYKETILEVEEGMKFYCTTDGYLDQNGGEKDFPFGKKRFGNIIKENHTVPMEELKTIFIDEMTKYETMIPNNDRNDDMTVIAFEIGKKSDFIENIVEEIVKYEGVMTQNVIASAMDNIEAKITNMGIMGTISTITIEYCQNMMNYSKGIREEDGNDIVPAGQIEVQNINNEYYDVIATNIISKEDKEKIEPKLIEIQGLDKAGIKKRYRELRKSGQNTHEKGGGIGMYEIAKISDCIEYEFIKINEDKYYFTMKSVVKPKVREKKEEEKV